VSHLSEKTNSLIFLVGPTAVGKTEVGILLAKQLNGEIVSCDAMQVYREINIASVKPTDKELQEVKHHCLNLVSVTDDFNVAQYRQEATSCIKDILERGKQPIIVGGSGMYMTVLLDGIFEQFSRDRLLREKLQKQAIAQGIGALHRQLSDLDPVAAGKIHPHDAKRIVRALEVCLTAGAAISQLQTQRQGLWGQMPIKIFALNRERDVLYKRVEIRVQEMFDHGLVEEIKQISQLPLSTTAQTLIGIREVCGHLAGDYDLNQAQYLMKLNTRHYVKRQLTWFRRDKRIEWIDMDKITIGEIVRDIAKHFQ